MLQTIFHFSILIYFFLSTGHLIWQFTKIPKDMKEIRLLIFSAIVLNLILLLLNLFVIFSK
jgi:hypothetical protein